MPLSGGETDKIGNRYEGRWTVFCMLDVIDEKADSISLEPLDIDGIEFFLRIKGKLEYHQVKRQRSGRGRWTLSALQDQQVHVLSDFWKNLSNPDVSCVFVSTQDADELGELANRARDAASWTEFQQKYLNKTLSGNFNNTLLKKWGNCSEIDAYEALKRVYVETVGEKFLVNAVENRLAALVDGDPKTVRIELADLALDKIHHELTTHDIWHYLLQERGYRRCEWGKDPHVLAAVDQANNRYLARLDKEAIAGKVIPRNEVDIILDKLTAPDGKRGILVTGEAGVGKSSVILQAVDALRQKGVPIIAFRLDNLSPTNLPNQVGKQLELPGSPAQVLANIAQKRDCVLIIDQLDAVSTASGRSPQFFECVEQIIDQVKAYPQMRLLLACRKFDLDYDYRFKRLTGENGIAETVKISRLTHEKVREVVAELGLDSSLLNNKQLDLLSIPLHLKLLAEVAESSQTNALSFKTAKDLYDKFWDYKKDVIYSQMRSDQWIEVLYTLCDYMSKNQRLSTPKTRVDKYGKMPELMVSEHILILDGQKYSFFHEGFFDYVFARYFAGKDEELLNFLGSKEQQHLFRRTQVRQILLYERDAEHDRYHTDLQVLLTNSNIRFHLKEVVLATLTIIDNPTQDEWKIIAPCINKKDDPLTPKIWQVLRSSVHWFQLLDSLGIIEEWLNHRNDERVDQTLQLLLSMQSQIPHRVAELVKPFIGVSELWHNRLNYLVQGADLATTDRCFFELFLRLIREGILAKPQGITDYNCDFWMQIYSLPQKYPDWACEAISYYLNYYLEVSIADKKPNLFHRNNSILPNSQFDEQVILESSRRDPEAFIKYLLPFMTCVMEITALKDKNMPWLDEVWQYRTFKGCYKISDALLNGMEEALSNLARDQPNNFSHLVVEERLQQSNFETVQYLLIRAYAANGEIFANEAIDYLCQKPSRLKTGYATCSSSEGASFWATYQLLEAITPHCSNEHLVMLEMTILNYFPEWEKSPSNMRYFYGHSQFVLLQGINPLRLSQTAIRRLQEWQRKFGKQSVDPPKPLTAGFIGSPIPELATQKMSDEQWLEAIKHYDQHGLDLNKDLSCAGGVRELSRLLERQVKLEPQRFATLVNQFPDDANPSYFDAVLQGIANVELNVQIIIAVCQRCHQLPQRPCGRWISWLIEKLAELPWTQEVFDIIIWYALNDPDPKREPQNSSSNSHDIFHDGINSTRGSAVSAIAKLIFADKNRASYFQQPLQKIVQDSSIIVRSCAAKALTAMLNYDRDLAVNLFHQLCNAEDVILGTQTVEYFLYYALPTHFQELVSIVERMIMCELPEVVKIGTRQACLASLSIEEAVWLAELCLSSTEIHQIAATEIFVANFRQAHLHEFCENVLIRLFNDSSRQVRSQAARCFLYFEGDELGNYPRLLEIFIDSLAFSDNSDKLIQALEKTTAKLPDDITYKVCDRFLESLKSENNNVRQYGIKGDKVSKLILKLYSQNNDPELKSLCLDLIDSMIQMGVYGLAEELRQYER